MEVEEDKDWALGTSKDKDWGGGETQQKHLEEVVKEVGKTK